MSELTFDAQWNAFASHLPQTDREGLEGLCNDLAAAAALLRQLRPYTQEPAEVFRAPRPMSETASRTR
jgi:hypothetical protein